MEREIAIEVKNLYISYRNLQKFSIKQSLLHFKKIQADVFQAVKDVSFEVEKGEILGIIGKNGSGKSTMLKALAGIFSPDTGSIDLKNHSVSLLSIGVGFEKEMSGRENIILSGMLLGFSEEFIRSKMDEIIEFAGLGKFIDMPVRTYSSGMYSKLAFSITAVRDEKFKKKSYEKMKSLISNRERTVVIVSHSLDTIADLCDKVMWMHEGKLIEIGTPDEVLPRYLEFMK